MAHLQRQDDYHLLAPSTPEMSSNTSSAESSPSFLPPYTSTDPLASSPPRKPSSTPSNGSSRRRPGAHASKLYPWTWSWGWEYVFLFMSLCCIVATIVLIAVFNNKPIPTWASSSRGVSLNTLLGILGTFSRASLLVPLEQALAQLMWIGFASGSRRLLDAEMYNEAARGPWGAARLLWTRRGRDMTSLGCALLVVSLGVNAATQQLLSYPTRILVAPDPSNGTLVSTMQSTYDSYQLIADTPTSPPRPALDFEVTSALFAALSPKTQTTTPRFACASGDCRFPTFATLAVCASCADNSSAVVRTCADDVCVATFGQLTATCWNPAGAGGRNYSTLVNQTAAEPSTALDAVPPGVMATLFTLRADLSVWPPHHAASTCRLRWCVAEVAAAVANASYAERVLAASPAGAVLPGGDIRLPFAATSGRVAGATAPGALAPRPAGNITVTVAAQRAFRTLATTLTGWSRTSAGGTWIHSAPLFAGFADAFSAQSTLGGASPFQLAEPNARESNNSAVFDALARSMSAALRQDLAVEGMRVDRVAVVSVRFVWVAYQLALWLGCAAFLVWTSWRARRAARAARAGMPEEEARRRGGGGAPAVGKWGYSSLALLLWSVDKDTRQQVGDGSVEEMGRRARDVKVRLVREDGGWRLRAADKGAEER